MVRCLLFVLVCFFRYDNFFHHSLKTLCDKRETGTQVIASRKLTITLNSVWLGLACACDGLRSNLSVSRRNFFYHVATHRKKSQVTTGCFSIICSDILVYLRTICVFLRARLATQGKFVRKLKNLKLGSTLARAS